MKIKKAVIPAAGLGTRVLPASKAMPKEMLSIVDKPAIQYIVEEAAKSGIEDILIITSRGKTTVEDHFDRSPERFDYMVNAQDFGFNHANCIGEVGFKDGELYLCQELYVFGKDTDEIIRLAEGRFQKRLTMYCDSAEPDRIRMWRKAGYRAVPVKKEPGSVHAQIDHLKQHKIHLHPSCVNTIKEIQQWKWRRDEKSGQYLDEPVNFFDDAMAMLRYSIEQERRGKVKIKTFKGGI